MIGCEGRMITVGLMRRGGALPVDGAGAADVGGGDGGVATGATGTVNTGAVRVIVTLGGEGAAGKASVVVGVVCPGATVGRVDGVFAGTAADVAGVSVAGADVAVGVG